MKVEAGLVGEKRIPVGDCRGFDERKKWEMKMSKIICACVKPSENANMGK